MNILAAGDVCLKHSCPRIRQWTVVYQRVPSECAVAPTVMFPPGLVLRFFGMTARIHLDSSLGILIRKTLILNGLGSANGGRTRIFRPLVFSLSC